MAIYHLSAQIIGRSGGRSAVAAAAYRAAEKVKETETEQTHDYKKKSGVRESGIEVPKDAPEWSKDRAKLWNSVQEKEARKNSQFAREINIALPAELPPETLSQLVRDFCKEEFAARGLAADWAIHEPNKKGDERNVHAHILTTTRKLNQTGWTEKDRESNSRDWLLSIRKSWEERVNRELERAGIKERIDCRTLDAQGITDRAPQIHQGPTAANMERKGKEVDRKRRIDAPKVVNYLPQELDAALEKDPEYQHIKDKLYLASIDPKDWHKVVEKYNHIDEVYKQRAFVEAVREWAPNRKKALVKARSVEATKLEELKGQEPKQGIMAKVFQEDYAKFEKKYNEWADRYNGIVKTYDDKGDEIKTITEALKEPTGKKLYEYGQGIKRAFKKAGEWLENRAIQILETASKFADYRATRDSYRAVEPYQANAVAALREQERQQKRQAKGHGRSL